MQDGVRDNPQAKRILTGALAAPEVEAQRHFAQGGTYMENPGASDSRSFMMREAIDLDAGEALRSFAGAEQALAKRSRIWTRTSASR